MPSESPTEVALVALCSGRACSAERCWRWSGAALIALSIVACDESGRALPDLTADAQVVDVDDVAALEEVADTSVAELPGEPILAEPQRSGNARKGFATLAGGDYVGCGVPAELYPVAEQAGMFGDEPKLPGRDSELPYYLSQFVTGSDRPEPSGRSLFS